MVNREGCCYQLPVPGYRAKNLECPIVCRLIGIQVLVTGTW